MTHSDIDNAYTSLLGRFSAMSNSASLSVKSFPPRGFTSKPTGKKRIAVNSLIYLPEWPYKSASDAKHVDILVKSAEVFECEARCMIESKVKVTYYKTEEGTATPLLAVHYDFDVPAQPAHPIFHAQLGTTTFAENELDDVGFRRQIQPAENPFYGNLRIPTAYMNLASVLLGIAADHLPPTAFSSFLFELRQNKAVNWNAACSALEVSIGRGGFLHSHHWY